MTINLTDNDPRISYSVGAGVTQTTFTVPFEFFDNDDLNVYVDNTLKTITTHYTVAGGDGSTGTVTISVTGASGGSTVLITRSIGLDRTTDFPSVGPFNIAALNTELDRMIAINADLKDQADRSLQLSDFETEVSTTLPDLATRKGKVLAFNSSTGVPEAGPQVSDISTIAAISADISTLADIEDGTIATDAISGLAAIKANVTTVAGISSNVTAVANDATDIGVVATDLSGGNSIGAVSSGLTNINSVAAISANITACASISSNITAVAGDATDIGNVAGSLSNINLVASNINSGVLTAVTDYGSVANTTVSTNDYGSV
tara:strand:- start:224 stop:1183 length:960 start_codon:yes stop_codon:yes gene_type:complete